MNKGICFTAFFRPSKPKTIQKQFSETREAFFKTASSHGLTRNFSYQHTGKHDLDKGGPQLAATIGVFPVDVNELSSVHRAHESKTDPCYDWRYWRDDAINKEYHKVQHLIKIDEPSSDMPRHIKDTDFQDLPTEKWNRRVRKFAGH